MKLVKAICVAGITNKSDCFDACERPTYKVGLGEVVFRDDEVMFASEIVDELNRLTAELRANGRLHINLRKTDT